LESLNVLNILQLKFLLVVLGQPADTEAYQTRPIINKSAKQTQLKWRHACIVSHTRTRIGDRRFSVVGPRLWNSLPVELHQPHVEIGQFRWLLKMFLFE